MLALGVRGDLDKARAAHLDYQAGKQLFGGMNSVRVLSEKQCGGKVVDAWLVGLARNWLRGVVFPSPDRLFSRIWEE